MLSKLNNESLILIVTSRCNLRCKFCQVLKDDIDMDFETAWRAVSSFLEGNKYSKRVQVKFFGGEPLLNFQLIQSVVKRTNKNYREVSFKLPTNGTLLDQKKIKFINDNPNIELVISSSNINFLKNNSLIKKIMELPLVTINMNFFPIGIRESEEQFLKLVKAGFSRFNFLPAYFILWPAGEILLLRKTFKKIAKFIQSYPGEIFLSNLKINSAVPLFNLAPTVDQNGDIFAGNFFMDKRLNRWRYELRLGNIQSVKNWNMVSNFSFDFDFLTRKTFPNNILTSTAEVDRELSRFVHTLEVKR